MPKCQIQINIRVNIRAALQIHDRSPKSRPVASQPITDADDATGRDRSWNATRPRSILHEHAKKLSQE